MRGRIDNLTTFNSGHAHIYLQILQTEPTGLFGLVVHDRRTAAWIRPRKARLFGAEIRGPQAQAILEDGRVETPLDRVEGDEVV